jgi:hypothetical protein
MSYDLSISLVRDGTAYQSDGEWLLTACDVRESNEGLRTSQLEGGRTSYLLNIISKGCWFTACCRVRFQKRSLLADSVTNEREIYFLKFSNGWVCLLPIKGLVLFKVKLLPDNQISFVGLRPVTSTYMKAFTSWTITKSYLLRNQLVLGVLIQAEVRTGLLPELLGKMTGSTF